jgi:hypothetical protein
LASRALRWCDHGFSLQLVHPSNVARQHIGGGRSESLSRTSNAHNLRDAPGAPNLIK